MEETEKSTEEKVDSSIELYEYDSQEWDTDILLDELERLYKWRETINRLIKRFKDDIRVALENKEAGE